MAGTRIGFVGAGDVATRHAQTLLGFDDVRIAAVADPAVDRAGRLAAEAGAVAYAGYDDMLEREDLDALYICIPPFAHGGPEFAALDAGLPFFVEKPLALDVETAESIAARVREVGVVTAVGYHWRYLDTFERARSLLQDNPARLALGYWLDKVPPPAWWVRRSLSGGQLIEQATHVLDLARVLVGEVTRVHATDSRMDRAGYPDADVPEVSAATLEFAGGAVGCMSSTCLLGWKHRAGIHLFADGMAVELSELEMTVDVGSGPTVQRAQGSAKERADRCFVDAVQGKPNRIRVPYSDVLPTHRLGCLLARSAEEGRPLEVPQ